MIAQLNTFAELWWQWMGSMFWQVTLLVILVSAIDKAIRGWAWPQVRYVLWGLVFIKLVIPPTWQMPTSIVSWVQPLIEKRISIQIESREAMEGISLEEETDAPVLNTAGKSNTAKEMSLQSVLFLGWIGGLIAFGIVLGRKMLLLRKQHRYNGSEKNPDGVIPDWFNVLLAETAARLKLRKCPIVHFSKDTLSPAVYGPFRPVLLLPEGFFVQLSREEAEHVLIHELCHLKRGDLWVHWFCLILQMVYWFNPLLIWTRRRMRYVCEICCDLSVANILREKTRYYRDTLIRTAKELFTETVEPGLGRLGVFEEPFRIVPRLQWLEKKTWENRNRKTTAAFVTCLAMFAFVMPMAALPSADVIYDLIDTEEPPRPIRVFPPKYPFAAIEEKIEGRVVIELVVTKDGTPKDPWVIDAEPPGIFEEAALEAVRRYQFAPGKRNGEAVDVRVKLPINFKVNEPDEDFQIDPEAKDLAGIEYEMFEVDRKPRVIRTFPPEYPLSAKQEQIEGRVVVRFVEDTHGRAQEPEVVIAVPYGVFEQSALEVIKLYQFEPAVMNGIPVACIVQAPIHYRLGIADQPSPLPEKVPSFNFNNAGIKGFADFVGEMTGKKFVVDDNVKGKVTVQSLSSISIGELNGIFESILDVNGFEAIPSGESIRIKREDL